LRSAVFMLWSLISLMFLPLKLSEAFPCVSNGTF
jgi:hypothetical protein